MDRYDVVRARLRDGRYCQLLNKDGEEVAGIRNEGLGDYIACQTYDFLVFIDYTVHGRNETIVYNVADSRRIRAIADTYDGSLTVNYIENPYKLVEEQTRYGRGRTTGKSSGGGQSSSSSSSTSGCNSCGCWLLMILGALVLYVSTKVPHGYIDDWSDLMCLVERTDCTVQQVEKALADGEKVNYVTKNGKSALWAASTKAPVAVVETLIRKGAAVDVCDDHKKRTPLMCVLAEGSQDRAAVAELLIKAGSNVNQQDADGDTPLHLAIRNDSLDAKTILLLLKTGKVKIEAQNGKGMTPLMIAAEAGRSDCVKMLLACKASVKAVDNKGNTALLLAVMNGNERCAALLKQAGADPKHENNEGRSALSAAKDGGNEEMIRAVSK